MGKLIQNILDSLKLTDEDDYFDDEDEMMETRNSRKEQVRPSTLEQGSFTPPTRFGGSKPRTVQSPSKPKQTTAFEEDEPFGFSPREHTSSRTDKQQSGRIVPIRPATHGLELSIMKPTRFEDSQDVCDMLKNECAIIINLEGLDIALAQRIMDFVSGAIYSLNAKIHQISGYVFCISPEKVDISGDYMDMIQQTGFEVPNLTRN